MITGLNKNILVSNQIHVCYKKAGYDDKQKG